MNNNIYDEDSRMKAIGEIRDMIQQLWSEGRFALVKEAMGEISYYNFSGVSDKVVHRIWLDLSSAPKHE